MAWQHLSPQLAMFVEDIHVCSTPRALVDEQSIENTPCSAVDVSTVLLYGTTPDISRAQAVTALLQLEAIFDNCCGWPRNGGYPGEYIANKIWRIHQILSILACADFDDCWEDLDLHGYWRDDLRYDDGASPVFDPDGYERYETQLAHDD